MVQQNPRSLGLGSGSSLLGDSWWCHWESATSMGPDAVDDTQHHTAHRCYRSRASGAKAEYPMSSPVLHTEQSYLHLLSSVHLHVLPSFLLSRLQSIIARTTVAGAWGSCLLSAQLDPSLLFNSPGFKTREWCHLQWATMGCALLHQLTIKTIPTNMPTDQPDLKSSSAETCNSRLGHVGHWN